MKIRSNYVSNSSSSSYIIEFKNLEDYIKTNNIEISIQDFLNQINCFNWGDENYLNEVTTDEGYRNELINYIKDYLFDVENASELIKDIKNSDHLFARFSLGYHDKLGQMMLNKFIEFELVKCRMKWDY